VLADEICIASPAHALHSAHPILLQPTAKPSCKGRQRSAETRRARAGVRVRLRDVRGARAGRRRAAPGDVADRVREACRCAPAPLRLHARAALGRRRARTPHAVCPAAPPPRPAAARPPRTGQAAAGPCPCAAWSQGVRGADPNPTLTHAGMGASKKWKYTLRVENNNLQFLGLWMMQHGYHFTTAPRCGGPCRAWPPRGPPAREPVGRPGDASPGDTLTWPRAVARPAALARACCVRWCQCVG